MYRFVKETNSETNKVVSKIEEWIKITDELEKKIDIKTGKLKSLSEKDKEELAEELEKIFIGEHPWLDGASTIGSAIKDVFDIADTLIDAIKTTALYIQLSEMSQGMKSVIYHMYEKCPKDDNLYLREALWEVSQASENLMSAVSVSMLHNLKDVSVDAAGKIMDKMWETVLSATPYGKVFLSAGELGIMISNMVFSTDEIVEKFDRMVCLQEVHKLLKEVINSSRQTFQNSKTIENADTYISAIDTYYKLGEISCDCAINFAEVSNASAIAQIKSLWKGDSPDKYIQDLNTIKDCYASSRKFSTKSYLDDLEADYPELYEQLYGSSSDSNEEEYVAVTGIQFPQHEFTMGVQDEYALLQIPIISPSNAINRSITYVSSDTSILEISNPIPFLTPHKTGTVTITASTEDGGFTDTIKVNVVEGEVVDFKDWNLPSVVKSGWCGKDAEYVLYDNGLLVISGTGAITKKFGEDSSLQQEKVKNVIIEKGITEIGWRAFDGCRGFTGSLTLPEGLEKIDWFAFYDCRGFTGSLELPEGLTSIGESAFYGCSGFSDLTVPCSLKKLEDNFYSEHFSCCNFTGKLILSEGLEKIGSCAFQVVVGLQET